MHAWEDTKSIRNIKQNTLNATYNLGELSVGSRLILK
jgi:hypothetical protein